MFLAGSITAFHFRIYDISKERWGGIGEGLSDCAGWGDVETW